MNAENWMKNTRTKKILGQMKGAFEIIADKAYERKMRHQDVSKMDSTKNTIPLYSSFG